MPNLFKMKKYFHHETAIVETDQIGEGTKIWAWTHISKEVKIGNNCVIGEGVHIGPNVEIGDNCKIQNHSLIYEGVYIKDNVFLGPNTITTNDYIPSVSTVDFKKTPRFKKTYFEKGCSIGANCTIICGVTIGEKSLIGAGSVITKNIPPFSKSFGNPCRVITLNK